MVSQFWVNTLIENYYLLFDNFFRLACYLHFNIKTLLEDNRYLPWVESDHNADIVALQMQVVMRSLFFHQGLTPNIRRVSALFVKARILCVSYLPGPEALHVTRILRLS